MAFIGLFEIFLALIFLVFLYHFTKNKVWNVPLVGLFLGLVLNFHKFHDKVAQLLQATNGTFLHKRAWLGRMNILFTSDPANVHHIMSANFEDYVKGPEWRKRFDIFGENSIFNCDSDEWKHQRKMVRAFLSLQELHQHIAKIIPNIIENGLIPLLQLVSQQDTMVDLQDLFTRYTFDFGSSITIGSNTNPLTCSTGLEENPFPDALNFAGETMFARHIVPEFIWKIQRWIGIGKEKQFRDSWKIIDQFCAKHISIRREQVTRNELDDQEGFNVLTGYLTGHEIVGSIPPPIVMRDNITSLIFATQDTTSTALTWFFWLLSKNPFAEIKIREELEKHNNFPQKEVIKKWQPCNLDQLNKLVYLHAAICEALRLFPPVPLEMRTPLREDTLPSGHQVDQTTHIVISAYAMGRMESIWGQDCCEFKPERWITKDGGIKHEASHKFFAFLAGPRICPGKEIGLTLMKAIITTIIHNYNVQVVESHPVCPNLSIIFRMKHGLMAKIKSRWA